MAQKSLYRSENLPYGISCDLSSSQHDALGFDWGAVAVFVTKYNFGNEGIGVPPIQLCGRTALSTGFPGAAARVAFKVLR
jgi:hypothetical protein